MIRRRQANFSRIAAVGGAVVVLLGLAAALPSAAGASGRSASGTPTVAGSFVSLAPARVLDTGNGTGAAKRPVASRGTVTVTVAGHGGVPATGVSAVALNVTVAAETSHGYLTAYPAGTTRPVTSTLNFPTRQAIANAAIVRLGTGASAGKISIYNASAGTARIIADVSGYYLAGTPTTAGSFVSLAPARVLDTGNGTGAAKRPVASRGTVTVTVAGHGGVPATGVSAVALNVTVAAETSHGYLTAYPAGTTRPVTSTLNFPTRQAIANAAIVRLGTGASAGKISIYNASAGTARIIADVSGYYLAGTPTTAGSFVSLAPARVLDTGNGTGAAKRPVASRGTVTVTVAGHGGVPATGVSAVALNVTVAAETSHGYLTAYPAGTTRPVTSTLNFPTRQAIANAAIVRLGTGASAGKISIYNASAGTARIIADVSGYYLAGTPTVTAVSPASGPPAGGTRVTVTGTGFVVGTTVQFGPTPGTSVTVSSASRLTVTAPAHAAGVVDVQVRTPSGTSAASAADRYTYAVIPVLAVAAGRCVFESAGPATQTCISPSAVAVDSAGNRYIADGGNSVVDKVTPDGTLSVTVGTGRYGAPTPGPATNSDLGYPGGLAVDSTGNLYIADTIYNTIEKVTPSGTLSIFAGTGTPGAPTPGPATRSHLDSPEELAVDSAGNLYIADSDNNLVEKVTSGGILSIFAGTGNDGAPTPGPATRSDLEGPGGVAVDSAGNLYIADTFNCVVEKVTPGGTLSIIAGIGSRGRPIPGPATSSALYYPGGVAVDSAGNLYIADGGNDAVEKVTPGGTLSIVAGNGIAGAPTPGPASSSELGNPSGVAVDSAGNLYIGDSYDEVVEQVTPGGTLSIVAGSGNGGPPTPGPGTSSNLGYPGGVAVDSAGNLYIADTLNNVVEQVTPGGTLSIIAGTGNEGAPTPGPATSSNLNNPAGVAVDSAGNLYIADRNNHVVEEVTPTGTLSIIAGTGSRGRSTPGPATSSKLNFPGGVAVDSAGNLYIADTGNNEVEKVTPGGTLSIIAGTGSRGRPTPGPATSSKLNYPSGVAVDAASNLYIADSDNAMVEKVTPGGILSIIAGTASYGVPTPGPATSSDLGYPGGVAVDSNGNLYISDTYNHVVEKVTPGGTLTIIAGTGNPGAPTPGPATSSDLHNPGGVAVDSAGNLYIADSGNNDVERVSK